MQHFLKHAGKSRRRISDRAAFPLSTIVLLFSMLGCGGNSIERTEVLGRVTLNGKLIPQGKIRFLPTDGPVSIATIQDGYYTTGTKGVPIGNLRIEIEAFRTPAGFNATTHQDPNDDLAPPSEQYLPAKYNLRSELTMIIEPGSRKIEKDFELATR